MHINVTDIQSVSESESVIFTMLAQGISDTVFILTNSGSNTINYRFQSNAGNNWVDVGGSGTSSYNTLVTDQTRTVTISTQNPQVRLLASASGGSVIQFSMSRPHQRASGGPIPIVGY